MTVWALQHGWTLPSDLASLKVCKEALAVQGVLFETERTYPPAAIKMHGMELLEAVHSNCSTLHDLTNAAVTARWASRLPLFLQRYMRSGAQWYGIPMGIHQANLLWVNQETEQAVGALPAGGIDDFIAWMRGLQGRVRHPLVVGAEPWQVGLVFEAIVLAWAGPLHYRQAFEQLDPDAWAHPRMLESLALMASLRGLVDHAAAHLPWTAQLQRLSGGQGAVQFMGDWVRSQQLLHVRNRPVPGTSAFFVAINDFFVPLTHEQPDLQDLVGIALTSPVLQSRYAQQKGCMPGVTDAWELVDPARAAQLRQPECVLPSFVFDQCGAVAAKNALLQSLARWFFQDESAREEAQRLSQICGVFRKTKGLP